MERGESAPVPSTADRLLIANNLSDNVILLDTGSGKSLQSFDLSRSRYIPSANPYTVIAIKPAQERGSALELGCSRGIGFREWKSFTLDR